MSDKVVLTVDLESGEVEKPFRAVEQRSKLAGKQIGRNISSEIESSFKSILKTSSLVTGALGAIVGGFSLKQAIEEANKQEVAVNRLNASLISAGKFSEEASAGFQKFASSLQSVTTFGDDVILESIALTRSLTELDNNGIKRVTKAALDLSSALQIDLTTATRLLSKASQGQTESLTRYGLQIQKTGDSVRDFEQVLGLVEQRFGGRAQQETNTFSGAIQQLRNNFGDLLETFGLYIVKNPFIIKAVKIFNESIVNSQASLVEFFKTFDLFNDVLRPLVSFNDALIKFVVLPIELVFNTFRFVLDSINTIVAGFVANIGKLFGKVADVLNIAGVQNETTAALQAFRDSSNEVLNDVANTFQGRNIFDFNVADALDQKNQELAAGLDAFNATLGEKSNETKQIVQSGFAQPFVDATAQIRAAAEASRATYEKLLQDANRVINQGLTRVVSGGIQNVIKSLTEGKNAFKEFGNFLLSAFGDLAIQLGEFYVATGLANLALLKVNPFAQIATGAALIAVGSILKSFSAGGIKGASGAGAVAGNAGQSGFNNTDLADIPRDLRREEKSPSVQVTIQGNVFDSEETGTSIARILSDAFGKQGVTITDPRFA
jgi:RNAse (barnase) inhibitor barstar